jgi:hypothetical protein
MLSLVLACLLGAFTILGGIFYLLPSLTVSAGPGSETITNPIYSRLSIHNAGYLTIYPKDVTTYISYCEYTNQPNDPSIEPGSISGIAIRYSGKGDIPRGETIEFTPEPQLLLPDVKKVLKAEFLVITSYRQWGWPKLLEKRNKFKVVKNAGDRWEWMRLPLNDIEKRGIPATIIRVGPTPSD